VIHLIFPKYGAVHDARANATTTHTRKMSEAVDDATALPPVANLTLSEGGGGGGGGGDAGAEPAPGSSLAEQFAIASTRVAPPPPPSSFARDGSAAADKQKKAANAPPKAGGLYKPNRVENPQLASAWFHSTLEPIK
jgi:hypothetical protein